MKKKHVSSGNPRANATTERIHRVPGNLVRTYNLLENYVYEAGPWMGILSAAEFAVHSTYQRTLKKVWAN